MAERFQFGLVVRGQAEPGEDIARRFQETLSFVRLADRLGFDSVTKTAHYSAHPFQMLQLVPMLARFTAEAPRLRLNAGVLLLPLLSPLHVAEEFATLDVMSGGKIILGVGLGYRDVEFKAFGVPRTQRARRFEANLVAIKRLWTEDKVTMQAGHFELDGASCLPKPLQQPHPPIWVGANAETRRGIVPAEAAAAAASADLGGRQCRPCRRAGGPTRRLLVYRAGRRDRHSRTSNATVPPGARCGRQAVSSGDADAPRGFRRQKSRRGDPALCTLSRC
jgi:alkanesulfonate monooxygenase SsuD/methylene tetrahydromethanopterin reductase-like flavin-dependent oxidoreductase (luciferase family)